VSIILDFKHGWRQRKKWREAKRAWRTAQRAARIKRESVLTVELGGKDLSRYLRGFDAQFVQDTQEVTPMASFQMFQPLGLPYAEFNLELMCDAFEYDALSRLLAQTGRHWLRVKRGGRPYLTSKVVFTTLTAGCRPGELTSLSLKLKSSGKVHQWL